MVKFDSKALPELLKLFKEEVNLLIFSLFSLLTSSPIEADKALRPVTRLLLPSFKLVKPLFKLLAPASKSLELELSLETPSFTESTPEVYFCKPAYRLFAPILRLFTPSEREEALLFKVFIPDFNVIEPSLISFTADKYLLIPFS